MEDSEIDSSVVKLVTEESDEIFVTKFRQLHLILVTAAGRAVANSSSS